MWGGTGRGREPRFPAEAAGAAPCDPRSHLPGRTGRAAAPWRARTLGEESRAAPRGGRWRCGCGSPAGGRACAGWAGHPLTLHGESSAPPLTARQAGAQGGRNRPRAPSHLQGVPGVRRGARRPTWRWWPRDTASLCLCGGGPAGTACPGRRVHGAGTREWNRPAARRGHTQREPRTGWGAPGNCTAELPVPHFRHAPLDVLASLTNLRVSPLGRNDSDGSRRPAKTAEVRAQCVQPASPACLATSHTLSPRQEPPSSGAPLSAGAFPS